MYTVVLVAQYNDSTPLVKHYYCMYIYIYTHIYIYIYIYVYINIFANALIVKHSDLASCKILFGHVCMYANAVIVKHNERLLEIVFK